MRTSACWASAEAANTCKLAPVTAAIADLQVVMLSWLPQATAKLETLPYAEAIDTLFDNSTSQFKKLTITYKRVAMRMVRASVPEATISIKLPAGVRAGMIPQTARLGGIVTLLILHSAVGTLGSRIAMLHAAITAYEHDIAPAMWTSDNHSICGEGRTMAALPNASGRRSAQHRSCRR